ncbi:hypothetical protein CLV53_105147 [Sediminibacterium magnilacihabitans]|jgi:hypothetical protein|nr:hypothetical protein CLV53_105147 [Sediminibacterium magnilacihabitans]
MKCHLNVHSYVIPSEAEGSHRMLKQILRLTSFAQDDVLLSHWGICNYGSSSNSVSFTSCELVPMKSLNFPGSEAYFMLVL